MVYRVLSCNWVGKTNNLWSRKRTFLIADLTVMHLPLFIFILGLDFEIRTTIIHLVQKLGLSKPDNKLKTFLPSHAYTKELL